MTREEAVLILTRLEEGCDEYAGLTNYAKEALQMAITALQTDGDCISRQAALDILDEFADNVLEVKHGTYERARKAMCDVPSIQPEPCEDAVSRKAVANMLDNIEIPRNASWYLYYHQALDRLTKLPSVQPEVIRCKDCIWYLKDKNCARHMKPFKPNGFCSEAAERRTDEH